MEDRVKQLHEYVEASAICTGEWHWLQWHMTAVGGGPVPFGATVLAVLIEIEEHIPGYAERTIDALASIGGPAKDPAYLATIVQRLAEVLVVWRLVRWGAPRAPASKTSRWPRGARRTRSYVLNCRISVLLSK